MANYMFRFTFTITAKTGTGSSGPTVFTSTIVIPVECSTVLNFLPGSPLYGPT